MALLPLLLLLPSLLLADADDRVLLTSDGPAVLDAPITFTGRFVIHFLYYHDTDHLSAVLGLLFLNFKDAHFPNVLHLNVKVEQTRGTRCQLPVEVV